MHGKTIARGAFITLVVLSLSTVAYGYMTYSTGGDNVPDARYEGTAEGESHRELTVVTTSERYDGSQRDNALIVYNRKGDVVYYNDTHRVYNDVDPVPGREATVLYVAAEYLDREECHATTECWRNVVEVANLTTGETRRVYSRVTELGRGQWHDVDRVNDSHLLVSDIALDRVYLTNIESGVVEWQWNAQSDFPMDEGGLFPGDWTHANDVELLDDGTVMASLRNQDQVVFIDRQHGLQEGRTLGDEDDHSVLYEQHNPDFIPRERGGPAVLVANSEKNRITEYQREGGEWVQSWEWEDERLMWPRDADRLPNGNTLITDTNGRRVVEVDNKGGIVWSVGISGAYDAERLGTGDESAGGPSADSEAFRSSDGRSANQGAPRNAPGRTDTPDNDPGIVDRGLVRLKRATPGLITNGILYVLPPWIKFVELLALTLLGVTLVAWGLMEFRWSPWTVRLELINTDEPK